MERRVESTETEINVSCIDFYEVFQVLKKPLLIMQKALNE